MLREGLQGVLMLIKHEITCARGWPNTLLLGRKALKWQSPSHRTDFCAHSLFQLQGVLILRKHGITCAKGVTLVFSAF